MNNMQGKSEGRDCFHLTICYLHGSGPETDSKTHGPRSRTFKHRPIPILSSRSDNRHYLDHKLNLDPIRFS